MAAAVAFPSGSLYGSAALVSRCSRSIAVSGCNTTGSEAAGSPMVSGPPHGGIGLATVPRLQLPVPASGPACPAARMLASCSPVSSRAWRTAAALQ